MSTDTPDVLRPVLPHDSGDRGGPAQPLLTIRGLTKHFALKKGLFGQGGGTVRAVDSIDFTVLKGETLGVVGESGCGKSTTARLLMQLIEPTAGEVVFDGRTVGGRVAITRKPCRCRAAATSSAAWLSPHSNGWIGESEAIRSRPRRLAPSLKCPIKFER